MQKEEYFLFVKSLLQEQKRNNSNRRKIVEMLHIGIKNF